MSCGLGPLQVPKKYNLSFPHQSPLRLISSFLGLGTRKLANVNDSPGITRLAGGITGTLGSL